MLSPFEELRGRPSSNNGTSITKAAERLICEHLLPEHLSDRTKEVIPANQQGNLVRQPLSSSCSGSDRLTILICGHVGRDQRCGITGPILRQQFKESLDQLPLQHPFERGTNSEHGSSLTDIELISHIGGHKFAGNVIIYIPDGGFWTNHPLAGMGVWYGRVEPRHVEGIVEETVGKGRIIKELFRGGIDGKGGVLRLDTVEAVTGSSL